MPAKWRHVLLLFFGEGHVFVVESVVGTGSVVRKVYGVAVLNFDGFVVDEDKDIDSVEDFIRNIEKVSWWGVMYLSSDVGEFAWDIFGNESSDAEEFAWVIFGNEGRSPRQGQ